MRNLSNLEFPFINTSMPNIYGTPNNKTFELIKGSNLDDLIFPLGGWDYVDGGEGIDTVVILGLSSQFKLVQENSITYIDAISAASKYANRVQLVNVEKVQFTGLRQLRAQVIDLIGLRGETCPYKRLICWV